MTIEWIKEQLIEYANCGWELDPQAIAKEIHKRVTLEAREQYAKEINIFLEAIRGE